MTEHGEQRQGVAQPGNIAFAWLGALGAAASVLALLAVQRVQFNVATYTTVIAPQPMHWPAFLFALAILAAPIGMAIRLNRGHSVLDRVRMGASLLWPLVLALPLAVYAFVDAPPPFALVYLLILGAGWASSRVGTIYSGGASRRTGTLVEAPQHADTEPARWLHGLALGSLLVAVAVLAVVHTRIQINFFEHFMLGHSDIGHFTEELKNVLAGRGLRSDSFDGTRLGWHFSPLLYVLVPGYALWPSPVYLMVCASLFTHLAALPAYFLARKLSGCVAVGWMCAAAWLLLPSTSRLVYCNTYGFELILAVIPLVGILVAAMVTGRRWIFWLMVALVLLCKETTAATTFGVGLYLLLFTRRRADGSILAVGSLAYLAICTTVLIPHFAEAGRYERMDLFGELGGTFGELLSSVFAHPDLFFGRLFRGQGAHFLLILLVPMALLPLRNWKLSLAAVPTIFLLLLLQNEQWLSVKFWHQAAALPLLFFAGIASLRTGHEVYSGRSLSLGERQASVGGLAMTKSRGIALALLVCAAWGHYFFGFSPISKPYEVYVNDAFVQSPDPRMEVVRRLRAEFSTDHTVLATERLAAHFTDYKRIYTGRRVRPADLVVIDRADRWDTSDLPARVGDFATDGAYRLHGEFGAIAVFKRRPDAPAILDE